MKRNFGAQYDICPTTYILPEDFSRFTSDRQNHPIWILKPSALSCGRGIKLIGRKSHIDQYHNYVVSKYILYPHLINGFKYDLRLYVVVTSFDPLQVYLYKEGLVRFATEQYNISAKNLKKKYMHLTNYSVNKNGYYFQSAKENDYMSSKWTLKMLKRKYRELGIDCAAVFASIKDLIIKTLISVEPHVYSSQHRHTSYTKPCYELYGFDILLDYELKPWLIEVNNGPSLSGSSELDRKIKTMLIADTFNLVGLRTPGPSREQKKTHRKLDKNMPIQQIDEDNILFQNSYFYQTVLDYEEQNYRKGQFQRIFPILQNYSYYSHYFEAFRPGSGNDVLWHYLESLQSTQGRTRQILDHNFGRQECKKV